MATATQTAHAPQIKIKPRRAIHARLLQAASRHVLTVESYCEQVLEAHAAQIYLETIVPLVAPQSAPVRTDKDVHKTKLSPGAVQRILHLHHSQAMGISELAARFAVDGSTIRRILLDYEKSEHVTQPMPRRVKGRDSEWNSGGGALP